MSSSGLVRLTAGVLVGLAASVGATAPAAAQGTGTVSGTVVDSASRRPVEGVQVVVTGTTLGTLTNASGQYSLRGVPSGTATLRALRLGYALATRQAAVVGGQNTVVDFAMRQVAVELPEVVSTGYGTSIRREVSASVSTVTAQEVQNSPVAGVDAALQGKAPGVQVIQNAGNPGVGITVRIRGSASISASNQPLYVVDGVPMIREDFSQIGVGGQDITAVTGLSPDEIETIDILKDAASAAIYGSRASNGVVMITTKRGRSGRARFGINAYTGTQKIERKIGLLNGPEFAEYINAARANDGLSLRFTPGVHDTISTDWQEAVLRNAPVSDVFLSVDGGTERMRYLVSGSYFDQEGIVIGSAYDRQTGRVNLDFNATNRISFRTSFNVSREMHNRITNDNTIEGVMANAIAEAPIFPVRYPDGRFSNPTDRIGIGTGTGLGYINPVAVGELNFRESRSLRTFGNVEGTVNFTDRLRLTARAGLDVLNLRDLAWDSPNIIGSGAQSVRGASRIGNNTASRYLLESYLGYDHGLSFGQFSLTGGASVEYNENELDFLRGEGFAHTAFQYPGNAASITVFDGDKTANNLVSFFTRANVTLRDRYLLTASVRRDGSSRFGEKSRYGVFPALSVGWIISDEPFAASLDRRADLKLRASYGETGNQDIGNDFASVETYGEAKYSGTPGIAPVNLGNPNLKWETTREVDLGFDLGMFNSRVTLTGDYYVKKTEDLLITRPITGTSGFTSVWDNVGNIENRGYELGLSTVNVQGAEQQGFRWTTNFNISWNKNKVTKLFADQPFNSGFDDINRYEVGQPMGAFYTVRFAGVDPQTGDAIYLDKDGVPHLFGDQEPTADDRVIVGSPHPDYWGGLTNTLSFKGFDLRGFVQFSQGGEIYNGMRAYSDDGGASRLDNKLDIVRTFWRKPGDVTDQPRPSALGSSGAWIPSSRWISDASYVRLQEITLGYRLPARLTARSNLQDVRVFVSGKNLKTWTDYKTGYNPDANSAGSSSRTTLGNEFYSYPLARSIQFGITAGW